MRVLMLDSDQRLISAVTRALESEGVQVIGAETAEEARAQLARKRFDVALLDCDVFDSQELASFSGLRVIATTSCVDVPGALPRDSAHVLYKPFTSAQLASVLRETCREVFVEPSQLLDILRRAHSERRTIALRVGEAELFLEGGELVHAEWRALRGEGALLEALSDAGQPVIPIPARSVTHTIHCPFQALLMGVLAQLEERDRTALRRSLRAGSGVHEISKEPYS